MFCSHLKIEAIIAHWCSQYHTSLPSLSTKADVLQQHLVTCVLILSFQIWLLFFHVFILFSFFKLLVFCCDIYFSIKTMNSFSFLCLKQTGKRSFSKYISCTSKHETGNTGEKFGIPGEIYFLYILQPPTQPYYSHKFVLYLYMQTSHKYTNR